MRISERIFFTARPSRRRSKRQSIVLSKTLLGMVVVLNIIEIEKCNCPRVIHGQVGVRVVLAGEVVDRGHFLPKFRWSSLRACLKIIPTAVGCGFRWLCHRPKWVFNVARLRFQPHFCRFLALESLAQPRNGIISKQALSFMDGSQAAMVLFRSLSR